MKFRNIQDTVKILKSEDPDTAITEYAIREWVKNDKITYCKAGSKVYLDIDTLKTELAGGIR